MNVVKCTNGHFFDIDSYQCCPHCGALPMSSVTASNTQKDEKKKGFFWGGKDKAPKTSTSGSNISYNRVISNERRGLGSEKTEDMPIESFPTEREKKPTGGQTLDFWQMTSQEDFDHIEPSKVITPAPVESIDTVHVVADETTAESTSLKEAIQKSSSNNEGKTTSYFSAIAESGKKETKISEPVAGWLVCIKGPNFGGCFSLYAGINSIGRGAKNRVIIDGDNGISREKHTFVTYEPKKRNFYAKPGESSGLTYVNDEYITETVLLKKNDVIEIGESRFMLIPLCGEDFTWEEYINKE